MKRLTIALAAVVAAFLLVSPASAHEEGTWVVRAGIGSVQPDSNNLDLGPAGVIEVDDGASLTLNFTYMFTPNWAVDVLAAWPFTHDITLGGVDVAETDQLPPTVSMQYHFAPDSMFQPYVGAGLNYTTFFSTDTKGPLAASSLDLDDSFGLALQLGADLQLNESWLVNLDVRYIDIESDAKLDGADLGTVKIDPWVYSLSVGYRF